ncbi:unnamed protein product [Cyprideis torosa]|uniref:Methionine adenosyltransferase 2 subunit beta n=1 Tax=Cyprideis torosa TaxID=163714 RepID=A0A7R8ZKA7_9CRUS|nr:unnamed protein product [Cyprideis torosa]CAG0890415.1 unnamed protein product [Cyprideis torosa]
MNIPEIKETGLAGCFLIEPKVFKDSRGYFFETFNAEAFRAATGTVVNFVQDNEAFSQYGVIRGLHMQKPPMAQAKLVRAVKGEVLDVAVDVRENSPTYGKSFAVVLSEENKRQLYIPHGFLHGYSVLSETAIFSYKCDNYYSPENEAGIYPLDNDLQIDWKIPTEKQLISDKDKNAISFAELKPIKLFQKLAQQYKDDYLFIFTDVEELDITNQSLVETFFFANSIDVCINCAAYTQVDLAEKEVELAFKINADGPAILAKECLDQNALMIHISTDYVFDGKNTTPYTTNDPVNPINVYGKSKAEGERQVMQNNPNSIIIRTAWVYAKTHGKNFYQTMKRLMQERDELSIVNDQWGCPTETKDIAQYIMDIISKDDTQPGIRHFTGKEKMTWFQFAEKIKEEIGATCELKPITTAEYPTPAERPMYSVLENS